MIFKWTKDKGAWIQSIILYYVTLDYSTLYFWSWSLTYTPLSRYRKKYTKIRGKMLKQKTVDSVCLSARRCCCLLGIRLWVSVKYLETILIETEAKPIKLNQIKFYMTFKAHNLLSSWPFLPHCCCSIAIFRTFHRQHLFWQNTGPVTFVH